MKYYPAPLFALQTLILQDIPRSLKTKKDASFTGETRTGKRSRPCVNHLQMSTPFKLLFNFRNRVNVDHPPFRCRHVVVSASRNRRRRKETERRSNREVPPVISLHLMNPNIILFRRVQMNHSRAIILCINLIHSLKNALV